jgi:uncharacterized protein YegJ (DUF2314 family)
MSAALCLAAAGCTQSLIERARNDEMPREDPALRRTAERAQATLDRFLTLAKQHPAGTSGYALKVKVEEGRAIEYFWVEEFTWSDGSLTGRINDEPRLVKGVQRGQIHRFSRSDVADWRYFDERTGKTVGPATLQ